MSRVDPAARVCPFCGSLPGEGMFCAACGRSLAGVERLPTRAAWEEREDEAPGADPTPSFLAAMRAAGNPGTTTFPTPKPSAFRRGGKVTGWVVRAVDREDFAKPRRYVPGVVLTVDGRFHQLDSELRGWGQRDFPSYQLSASAEPVDAPPPAELRAALEALRVAHGLGPPAPPDG
jgi:hypothetical protein